MFTATEIKNTRELDQVINHIRTQGRKEGVSFEDREFQIAQIMEDLADQATEAGYGAKQELGREHTQIGTHNRVQYSTVFYAVNPKGERVGNHVFGDPNWATVYGFFLEKEATV